MQLPHLPAGASGVAGIGVDCGLAAKVFCGAALARPFTLRCTRHASTQPPLRVAHLSFHDENAPAAPLASRIIWVRVEILRACFARRRHFVGGVAEIHLTATELRVANERALQRLFDKAVVSEGAVCAGRCSSIRVAPCSGDVL